MVKAIADRVLPARSESRTLEVLARGENGRFVEVLAEASGAHAVSGCEGPVVELGARWAELDRWPDADA